MFTEILIKFIVFWGIWIFIPVLMDGTLALRRIIFSWRMLWKKESVDNKSAEMAFLPPVSVIIPVHNSEQTLYNCLKSLAEQSYPVDRIKIFLVDNGSTDGSFQVFNSFVNHYPNVPLRWVRIEEPGKAKALNSGIFLGNSDIVINVDSDTRLDCDVILQTVEALTSEISNISGATAAIMIDFKLISKKSRLLRMIQSCEAIEYLQSFFIGRRYESYHNTLFTLAGAFSCFNKQDLLQTYLYDQNSLSEDTKLTFELRRKSKNKKVAFLEKAKVYVEPIPSLSKLYAQRVRWQRGELDVIGSYMEYYKGGLLNLLSSFAARLLFIDHTMIFPRIVWTFLLPFLIFLGYPLELIVLANIFVYLVYLAIDINYLLIIYFYLDKDYKNYLKNNWWRVIFMPFYRFIVFWFRAAAAIHTITDAAEWSVKNPVLQTKEGFKRLKASISKALYEKKSHAPGAD